MENENSSPELAYNEDFQKQLEEVLDSMRGSELESETGPDKRGMIGEPRAIPVISDSDEDNSDDIFFTCEYPD